MALATQCPHCHTIFRVVHDQLKLRAGLVRCGACKEIFNGIGHLLLPDEVPGSMSAPLKNPRSADAAALLDADTLRAASPVRMNPLLRPKVATFDFSAEHNDVRKRQFTGTPAQASGPLAVDASPGNPMLRMTLMDFRHIDDAFEDSDTSQAEEASIALEADATQPARVKANAEVQDDVALAIDELQGKPWSSKISSEHDELDRITSTESEEPSFVTRGRKRQRVGRVLRMALSIGSFILLLSLLVQSTYAFRNQLAAWLPQTKPMLTLACTWINCKVTLPAQIEAVSIESSELQALALKKNGFVLTMLLRNESATDQAWPHMELVLNDGDERAIARRIFTPQEYLPQDPPKGFGAKSEQPVKITFELLQLKASGYRVYLYYP